MKIVFSYIGLLPDPGYCDPRSSISPPKTRQKPGMDAPNNKDHKKPVYNIALSHPLANRRSISQNPTISVSVNSLFSSCSYALGSKSLTAY